MPDNFYVMCLVSGGVTGTRQSLLKSFGDIKTFTSREEAEREAESLSRIMNGNPYRTAQFQYWVVTEKSL